MGYFDLRKHRGAELEAVGPELSGRVHLARSQLLERPLLLHRWSELGQSVGVWKSCFTSLVGSITICVWSKWLVPGLWSNYNPC